MTHLERKSNPFLVADKKKQWKEQRGKAKKQAVYFNALEDDKHLNLPLLREIWESHLTNPVQETSLKKSSFNPQYEKYEIHFENI